MAFVTVIALFALLLVILIPQMVDGATTFVTNLDVYMEKAKSSLPDLKMFGKAFNLQGFLESREKLMNGILKSCHKRPVSSTQIENLVRDVENTIKATGKKEIPSGEIGRLVMERLKEIDDIAYVRFASVYREFRDVETFLAELQEIKDGKSNK